MNGNSKVFEHTSVLVDEITDLVGTVDPSLVIDATLGLGGHSEAILSRFSQTELIGIDQDIAAAEIAKERLSVFGNRFRYVHRNFSEIKRLGDGVAIGQPSAIIADLGVSSMQLDDADRGFSFRFDAPLDMRMDIQGGLTAADLLKTLDETDLANVIFRFGEERASRRIARAIKYRLAKGETIDTTFELARLIERSLGRSKKDKIHPATRTFQALRIAVNRELDVIEPFIRDSIEILASGGLLGIITFHSLEDRIVKQTFRRLSGKCECPPRSPVCMCGAAKLVDLVTKKPIVPGPDEIESNPRSRSAKLRVCKKI